MKNLFFPLEILAAVAVYVIPLEKRRNIPALLCAAALLIGSALFFTAGVDYFSDIYYREAALQELLEGMPDFFKRSSLLHYLRISDRAYCLLHPADHKRDIRGNMGGQRKTSVFPYPHRSICCGIFNSGEEDGPRRPLCHRRLKLCRTHDQHIVCCSPDEHGRVTGRL